jgi:hypothetical protein
MGTPHFRTARIRRIAWSLFGLHELDISATARATQSVIVGCFDIVFKRLTSASATVEGLEYRQVRKIGHTIRSVHFAVIRVPLILLILPVAKYAHFVPLKSV